MISGRDSSSFSELFFMLFSMEQRVLIKCLREEDHESTPIHSKFMEHSRDKAVSDPDVSHWMRQFPMGRESAEDSRGSKRPLDFQTHFRIKGALEALLNASVRDLVQPSSIAPSRAFSVRRFFIWNFATGDRSPTN
jgi:hypothetical protein